MPKIKIDKLIVSKRRSIALEIAPDAALIVRAPRRIPHAYIQTLIWKKQAWILKMQQQARLRLQNLPALKFVSQKEAFQKIKGRVDWYCSLTGLKYRKLSLSKVRRRWGSCNSKGDLRINWRLAMASGVVLDYVIVHELMHLVEQNHSKRFWNKVSALMPDYKQQRKWLRENGPRLPFLTS
ncbi:MAG: M48 family metallopeptidase [Candidatus Saganbacteria bacterium]|nr:M48 family metallopeptidase [Candidatus Saganbacteria bacterium]